MDNPVEITSGLDNGRVTGIDGAELAKLVLKERKIVLLKHAFPNEMLQELRRTLLDWGREVPAVATDDFQGNYHRHRAMVSHLQKWPHVFHDYNFNDFSRLEEPFRAKLTAFFEPLRLLYNNLTNYDVQFGVPESGPYLHPQFIHYPVGGGFFARHWHEFMPQKLGLIVSMSEYGKDYPNGGTVFEVDGEPVDVEGLHDMGDICVWRYDYDHWVKQSDLRDRFDWNSENGRWVATFPYYDPTPRG